MAKRKKQTKKSFKKTKEKKSNFFNKIVSYKNTVIDFVKKTFTKKQLFELERKTGWLKDEPDIRDFFFGATVTQTQKKVYTPVDLRKDCPPVLDQQNLSSCTAFGVIGLVQYARKKQNFKDLWQPSPLFTYYTTRELQGTVSMDSGASVRNALKSAANNGVLEEKLWPYVTSKWPTKPPATLYKKATDFQALSYRRINDGSLVEMQDCLDQGYPFIFGMMIYDSFVRCPKTGIVPMPDTKREKSYGGHCLMCVGWKLINGKVYFILQNSWGTSWGENGFCYVPAEYVTNSRLACDFWMIRIMEN